MFAESLLESGNAHPRGRGWATTLSLAIQSLLLAMLIAVPLFRPAALPVQLKSVTAPIAFGSPDVPPTPQPAGARASTTQSQLETPPFIPADIPTGRTSAPATEAPPVPCFGPCLPPGPGSTTGTVGSIPLFTGPAPVVKPPAPTAPRRVSVIDLGAVVRQVRPVYPPIAQQIRLEGTVVLRALIARDGRVTNVQVLSGHGLFHESARAAVTQWRYRPYILNGEPVEVETHITVNYRLAR